MSRKANAPVPATTCPHVPHVKSPTYRNLQKMSEAVMEALGGPAGAADKLSGQDFMTLAICSAMDVDEAAIGEAPILAR